MPNRHYTFFDQCIINLDTALTSILGSPAGTGRSNPAQDLDQPELSAEESRKSAALMRINHAGEISAQALYQGQALTAKKQQLRDSMKQAADEENDHLLWCQARLQELDSHTSHLNPLWYAGSFAIGAIAGAIGDQWSLGFVAETERQVVKHLQGHLEELSDKDHKSIAILEQMKIDEARHATTAIESGAAELPQPVKKLMGLTSMVMTKTAYWI